MTAIAAVSHRGRIWMASDTRVGNDEACVRQRLPKIERLADGSVLVGYAGGVGVERTVRSVDWAADWESEILRRATEQSADVSEFDLLIGHKGRLWFFQDRSIFEAGAKYAAIGSGELVCLGYLAATAGEPPESRVRGAVRAAIEHVPTCGGRVCSLQTLF